MGDEVREMTHEAHPGPQDGKSEQQGARAGDGQHDEGILEPQRDERAEPQADVRGGPRPCGRQQPPHDDEQVRHPPRHGAPLPLAGHRDDREPRKYEREARAGGNGQIDVEAGERDDERDGGGTDDDGKRQRADRHVTPPRSAAGGHQAAHPREEGAQHPPDRQVPPRAAAVGGGSTWWYLPIWWMLGTFLAWMGGLVTAGRAARGGDVAIGALALPVVVGAAAIALVVTLARLHVYLPVAAGAGFALVLTGFAVVAMTRKG